MTKRRSAGWCAGPNYPFLTQKERDIETGLDYFLARYYSSPQGRFTSPDEPFVDQWEFDPQTWNLYTYVRNNPLNLIDPTGNFAQKTCDEICQKSKAAYDEWRKKAEAEGIDSVVIDSKRPAVVIVILVSEPPPADIAWERALRGEFEFGPGGGVRNVTSRGGSGFFNWLRNTRFGKWVRPGQKAEPAPNIPQHARDVLNRIKQKGEPPSGYRGGKEFMNDGRGGGQVLPSADAKGNPISYREYDVHPYQPGVNRGPERIVRGSDGSAWFTNDHYRTFTPIE